MAETSAMTWYSDFFLALQGSLGEARVSTEVRTIHWGQMKGNRY